MVHTLNGTSTTSILHNQQFLLTSSLNQDPLENNFLVILNDRGSFERNHSWYMFHSKVQTGNSYAFINAPANSSYDVSEAETLLKINPFIK